MFFGNIKEVLRKFDWVLFGAVVLLICLGLAAIYSVGLSSEVPNFSNFKKQIAFASAGVLIVFFLSLINYSAFRVYGRIIYAVAFFLLVAVLFFGSTIRGTTGWFAIGGLGFQPVELAKIALIIFLAKFFANRFQQFNQSKHIIVSLVGTLLLVCLVIVQPDLGSALVLLGVWFIMLVLTGVRLRYLIGMVLILALVSAFAWAFLFQPYQKDRVISFLDPASDPLGSGYNVSQAIIAVGSGQVFGRGLGFGSQSQLKFIPESQTDFVFAVIAEELGLLGVSLILGLWLLVFYRLMRAAKTAHDDFGLYLIIGISIVFFIHLMINIGMNLGMLPVTGISLPFLSYGGSFMIVSLILIGMAQSVVVRR